MGSNVNLCIGLPLFGDAYYLDKSNTYFHTNQAKMHYITKKGVKITLKLGH